MSIVKNESVKAVVLTALGVTAGILLYFGGQMAYSYIKAKMAAAKTNGGTTTTEAAAPSRTEAPVTLRRVA